MRELSIIELDLVVGGYGGGYYDYGSSYLSDDGTGMYSGVVYEADAQAMQAQASTQSIDWGVEGTVGNGGWSVKATVGGKS